MLHSLHRARVFLSTRVGPERKPFKLTLSGNGKFIDPLTAGMEIPTAHRNHLLIDFSGKGFPTDGQHNNDVGVLPHKTG